VATTESELKQKERKGREATQPNEPRNDQHPSLQKKYIVTMNVYGEKLNDQTTAKMAKQPPRRRSIRLRPKSVENGG